jgi:apolipoprotein N-acyltransferase
LVFFFILALILAYGAWRLSSVANGPKLRVALVQGNVALGDYWDPRLEADTVQRYLELSREALVAKPDLVIWPETAFPQFLWDHPELFSEVKRLPRQSGVPLIFGAVTREGRNYFNSAIFVNRSGEVGAIYSKLHLVVFGEYIPFRKELPFLADIVPIDDFTPGLKPVLFPVREGVQVGTLICFEDTVPWLARRLTREGANVLVNITNDAWFRDSAQPEMHLNNALFRVIENRRPLVRATNTGVSCLIDSRGVVGMCVQDQDMRRTLVQGWAVGEVTPGAGETFYSKYGDIFTLFLFIGILGMFIKPIVGRKSIMEGQETGKKILIIDDDRMLHSMLQPILKSYGFEVVSALTGEEGLQMASAERPDVIILDVIMPKMKGREVCKRLKESPDTKNIPVLFLTSKDSEDEIKAELEIGAAGHITKPVHPEFLVRRINEILK